MTVENYKHDNSVLLRLEQRESGSMAMPPEMSPWQCPDCDGPLRISTIEPDERRTFRCTQCKAIVDIDELK